MPEQAQLRLVKKNGNGGGDRLKDQLSLQVGTAFTELTRDIVEQLQYIRSIITPKGIRVHFWGKKIVPCSEISQEELIEGLKKGVVLGFEADQPRTLVFFFRPA